MYGSNLIWFNVLNATASLVLGSPPYDFPAWAVGVAYLAPLLGAVIGTVYTGFLGDWIVVWGARRKDGITEPEHRLWLFAPSIVLTPSGLILWGVGQSSTTSMVERND